MKDRYQYIREEEEIKLSQRMDKIDRRQNRIIFILFFALIITLAGLIYISFFELK